MLVEFSRHYGIPFKQPSLLRLALTHRSYLSVTGQGPRESNERLEFLGDSVLGLVTSEYLYRQNPDEHEGQLTKTKSLLVSKAILSRRALAMGLGRFVLMSHSEVESGGRQRLSILADAFESVIGAIYLDQGFEAAQAFIERWLLRESEEIVADKRHINYKSHLQEYVQSTFRTHPVYRIRGEMGPDHSKHFSVEVMVGRRVLGEGKGRNKKEAEQAAARDALDRVDVRRSPRGRTEESESAPGRGREPAGEVVTRTEREVEHSDTLPEPDTMESFASDTEAGGRRRRGRRGGRGRRSLEPPREERVIAESPKAIEPVERREAPAPRPAAAASGGFAVPPEDGRFERLRLEAEKASASDVEIVDVEESPPAIDDDEEYYEEVGRPEGPLEERHVDLYAWDESAAAASPAVTTESAPEEDVMTEREESDARFEDEESPRIDDDEPASPRDFDEEIRQPSRESAEAAPAPHAAPRPAGGEERKPSGGYGRRRGRRGR